jgi:hypothetical protein
MHVNLLISYIIQCTYSCLRYVNSGRGQIQDYYSPAYTSFNIQLNVAPPLLVVCQQFNAHCIPHLLPNTAHVLLITLCQLWSNSNPMLLQFCINRLQHSIEPITADIGDMTTIRYTLYSSIAAKYSAHHVRAISTLGHVKFIVIEVLEILS